MLQSAVGINYIIYWSKLQFTVGAQLVFRPKLPHSAQSQNSQNWFPVYTWAAFGMKTILTMKRWEREVHTNHTWGLQWLNFNFGINCSFNNLNKSHSHTL